MSCYKKSCKLFMCGWRAICVAPQGEGKTATDVIETLESIKHHEHNWNDYDIILPKDIKKTGPAVWNRIYEEKYFHRFDVVSEILAVENAYIHIDESAHEFDARYFQDMTRLERQWTREAQKRHIRLKMIVQVFKDLDISFGRQASEVYQLYKRPFGFIFKEHWHRFNRDINIDPPWAPEEGFSRLMEFINPSNWYRLNKKIFNAYDRSQLSSLRELADKKTREKNALTELKKLSERKLKEKDIDAMLLELAPNPK